jgi:hypothetical protein
MHHVQEEMVHASRARVNRTSRMVQLAPEGEIYDDPGHCLTR